MSQPHGIVCLRMISVTVCAAAMILNAGAASADRHDLNPQVAQIDSLDRGKSAGDISLNKAVEIKTRDFIDPVKPSVTELLLVTSPSCPALPPDGVLNAVTLSGQAGESGDWVLLAGLRWNKANGFGSKGPVLIETADGKGSANWYFTVDMLFIPRDNWNVRAGLAFDAAENHHAFAVPSQQLNPLQIGVALSFDYGARQPAVLDLGYGRLPLEGRSLTIPSGSVQPDQAQTGRVLSDTWIISACLNIQF